jgi:hypothetical protein
MQRNLAIAIAIAFCAMPAFADRDPGRRDRGPSLIEPDADNSFFLEGGGPGLLYSINYERRIENDFGLRIGVSYQSFSASASSGGSTSSASAAFVTVPVIASYLGIRSGNHILELGAGGTAIYASGSASGTGIAASGSGMTALGTAIIGYRRQPLEGGFQFRVGLEALMGKGLALSNPDPNAFGVLPWMYLSFGFSL